MKLGLLCPHKGQGSYLLNKLAPGDKLIAKGPFGKFIFCETEIDRHYYFIATGSGINPYRAMLPLMKKRLKENPAVTMSLAFGIPTRKHLFYQTDFLQLAQTFSQFSFSVYYSDEQYKDLQSFERNGLVLDHLNKRKLNSESTVVYLCGNPNMIRDQLAMLQTDNPLQTRIIVEKFLSPILKQPYLENPLGNTTNQFNF